MQGAVVYRWTGTVPGREKAGLQLVRDSNAYAEKLMAVGRITDYAWYLSAQGGASYFIIRGEMEQLMANTGDPELLALNSRSGLINENLTWGFFATGDSANGMVDVFEQSLAQFD